MLDSNVPVCYSEDPLLPMSAITNIEYPNPKRNPNTISKHTINLQNSEHWAAAGHAIASAAYGTRP